MATIAAILASATHYVSVQELDGPKTPDGIVVTGKFGTVAKADNGKWRHYEPIGYEDTPCYPCSGWQA